MTHNFSVNYHKAGKSPITENVFTVKFKKNDFILSDLSQLQQLAD
jgi:hypothetical protein